LAQGGEEVAAAGEVAADTNLRQAEETKVRIAQKCSDGGEGIGGG
jgi:hypothetical protein